MAFAAQVGEEDDAPRESVQRGLRSGMVAAGPAASSAARALIHHFQGLVYQALSEYGVGISRCEALTAFGHGSVGARGERGRVRRDGVSRLAP